MSVVDVDRLRYWGYRDWVAEAADSNAEIGRVVRVDRGQCDVITAEGLHRVWSDSVRAQSEIAPVTGDWVQLAGDSYSKVIAKVLSRQTALSRRDPAERESEQVLAANIDVVGIAAALDRPLPPGSFERFLIMALDSGASMLIVLTKTDKTKKVTAAVATVKEIVGSNVAVVATSTLTGIGLEAILSYLGLGQTLVLVGASGSGKSALVNALADAEVMATGEVRAKDSRGRHTTVVRQLVLLPDDAGLILDTPGVRSLGLWDCEEALSRLYGDIEKTSANCRFSDCHHISEPHCAVQIGVERGEISPQRLARAQVLKAELEKQKVRIQRRN